MRFSLIWATAAMLAAAAIPAIADDEADHSPAAETTARCLQLVRAEDSFPKTSAQKMLEAHQQRMRTICWDWRAASFSENPDKPAKGQKLFARCMGEAHFDLGRMHQLYYTRHAQAVEQMCRDFERLIANGSAQ